MGCGEEKKIVEVDACGTDRGSEGCTVEEQII